MDDILILANKRWQFRKVVKEIQQTTQALGLRLHDKNKRFIGRIDKYFEFLGYFFPGRRLRPSSTNLKRLSKRARWLYEQGAGFERLRLIRSALDKLAVGQTGRTHILEGRCETVPHLCFKTARMIQKGCRETACSSLKLLIR